jgi:cell division initiation protein
MSLTPMDIHNKEFARGFRGYNEDEVDQFLDKIVDEFEKLYKENIEQKDKISALGDQISQYRTMENTLKETLVTAQKTADEVTALAQKKAELILKEAEEQARRIIESANSNVVEIKKEYQEAKKQVQIFKSKFRTLLETQMEMVSGDAAVADDPFPAGSEE